MEINDHAPGTYKINSQIKFKTTTSKSNFCGYGNTYILVKGTITGVAQGIHTAAMVPERNSKEIIFKDYTLFTDCEVNNIQVDNAKNLDVVIPLNTIV